jgi:hypothetical protein
MWKKIVSTPGSQLWRVSMGGTGTGRLRRYSGAKGGGSTTSMWSASGAKRASKCPRNSRSEGDYGSTENPVSGFVLCVLTTSGAMISPLIGQAMEGRSGY